MKKIIITVFSLLSFSLVKGQNEEDIYRYSQNRSFSTARVAGLGGAFGALGGDVGGLTINPAGLGVFRSSAFQASFGLGNDFQSAEYINNNKSGYRLNLSIPNATLVVSKDLRKKYKEDSKNDWNFLNWSLGYNQTHSFSGRRNIDGLNSKTSLIDKFVYDSNDPSIPLTEAGLKKHLPYTAYPAYMVYLINPDTSTKLFYNTIPLGVLRQKELLRERGGKGDLNMSVAANYGNKLFLGGSINVSFINYTQILQFTETDASNNIPDFRSFTYTTNLTSTGTSFTGKLGFIYVPVKWIRVGVGATLPTLTTIEENYVARISSAFDDNKTYDYKSDQAYFKYKMYNPGNVTFSGVIMPNEKGLISFDYQNLKFGSMETTSSIDPFWSDRLNTVIQNTYNTVNNYRLGLEYRVDKFVYRVGGAYWSSPIKNITIDPKADQTQINVTGGFSIVNKNSALDFSAVYSQLNSRYTPYQIPNQASNFAIVNRTQLQLLTTLKLKF